ncbi:MAG: hypothetical protein JRF52_01920 [Deltaproteobacteria bacterium]|nr:hypothetical protein [Deltaproteobacteria bacterium]MBW2202871.1 hypothetical protein [Deltaproteobacteria bacterium]
MNQIAHKQHIAPLKAAIVHVNVSLPMEIDEDILIACIRNTCYDQKWKGHILSFFLETPIWLIHDIVLSGVFSFEDLTDAQNRWQTKEYADENTTRWIQEMAYLSMGKAAGLGIACFI